MEELKTPSVEYEIHPKYVGGELIGHVVIIHPVNIDDNTEIDIKVV